MSGAPRTPPIHADTVEFLGVCGAGKTTVMDRFTQSHGATFGATIVPPQPDISRIKFVFHVIRIVLRSVFSRTAGAVSFFFAPRNLWLPLKLGYRLAGRKPDGQTGWKFFVDSGLLQPFVSFEAEENRSGRHVPLAAFLSCIPLPEVIVFVAVPPEMALDRYRQRGGKAVSRYDESRLRGMFYAADAVAHDLVRACAARGVRVIEVGNDSVEALSKAADTIHDTLNRYRTPQSS